jgi:membrane protein insertase Oxa1/YidC/SpoIIIJ
MIGPWQSLGYGSGWPLIWVNIKIKIIIIIVLKYNLGLTQSRARVTGQESQPELTKKKELKQSHTDKKIQNEWMSFLPLFYPGSQINSGF